MLARTKRLYVARHVNEADSSSNRIQNLRELTTPAARCTHLFSLPLRRAADTDTKARSTLSCTVMPATCAARRSAARDLAGTGPWPPACRPRCRRRCPCSAAAFAVDAGRALGEGVNVTRPELRVSGSFLSLGGRDMRSEGP